MIYVVILNWKAAADTIACVQSVLGQKSQCGFKVIIVDNCSPDESFQKLCHFFESFCKASGRQFVKYEDKHQIFALPSEITLIKNSYNAGYAGGNNVGIAAAMLDPECSFVWVLNNDTAVAERALDALVDKCNKDPMIGICGSKLVKFDDRDTLQGLGGKFNAWTAKASIVGENLPTSQQLSEEQISNSIDYVIGASLFLRSSVIREIGMLSEDYFLYCEEIDYAHRINGRFRQAIALNSVVYHKEGASTGGASELATYHSVRSRLIYTRKFHNSKLNVVRAYIAFSTIIKLRPSKLRLAVAAFRALKEI